MDLKHDLMYCEDKMLGVPGVAGPTMNGVVTSIKAEAGGPASMLNGNGKRPSPEHWDSSPSHSDSANAAPPLTPSPGPNPHHYTVISNGYSSPMSSGSYDPYSPNGKLGREDLSPPSSLNGYSMDSSDVKKKKAAAPRQQEELCLVCGDRASGYHYNALTCEGCKGFFRRSITKNAVYQCKYGNGCEIDMYMRRKCQECRLKKCLAVGMRPECVVPEYQCAVKRKEKKAQKDKDKPNSTTNGSSDIIKVDEQGKFCLAQIGADSCFAAGNGGSSMVDKPLQVAVNGVKPVSPEQEELIHRLVYFQNEFEHPSEDELRRVNVSSVDIHDDGTVRFHNITEITILTVQLIVEFAKRLPGFDKLQREDQLALLKACSSEVMMLRMARCYDAATDSIVFANHEPYNRSDYLHAGFGDVVEDLLAFCRHMCGLRVDNAEYALLTAVVIFSDRPSLNEGWKVEKIQDIYVEALRTYIENRRQPRPSTIFAKLLSVLTELRTLGNLNSELCFSLKIKNKKLPPFLAEIWDVAV